MFMRIRRMMIMRMMIMRMMIVSNCFDGRTWWTGIRGPSRRPTGLTNVMVAYLRKVIEAIGRRCSFSTANGLGRGWGWA